MGIASLHPSYGLNDQWSLIDLRLAPLVGTSATRMSNTFNVRFRSGAQFSSPLYGFRLCWKDGTCPL